MTRQIWPVCGMTALCMAVGSAQLASAQQAGSGTAAAEDSRPRQTRIETDYQGMLQVGVGYTSDDNFMFGQYNGLHEEGANLIGNLNWQDFSGDSWWRVSASDLGLKTREGAVTWGRGDRLRLSLEFDSQLQVRNNSGATPFTGGSDLRLPGDWVSAAVTSDFGKLDTSLQTFKRELERNAIALSLNSRLNQRWDLRLGVSYQEREGTRESAGAIYVDRQGFQSALLPAPVDESVTEFDLGLAYRGDRLHLDGSYYYSDFDNNDEVLTWDNPYSSFGPAVAYPEGRGGLGLAPDNTRHGVRGTAVYIIDSKTRLQLDGGYHITEQNQTFLDYTVNDALTVPQPLPRDDLGGEVSNGVFNAKILMRPLPKANLELYYRGQERDYDTPRDGYRYPRGDATNQPDQSLTVYNTRHSYTSNTFGIEGGYRLPLRSKLTLGYEYEDLERENAAVQDSEEARYLAQYRIAPWSSFSARLELAYADRSAGTYEWAQSYYALLDTELINATPDSQRYINHPDLSQYHLANRERGETKLDLDYRPGTAWQLNLNLLWREDDYDKSQLGLIEADLGRINFSTAYFPSDTFIISAWLAFDRYEAEQRGLAFNGGVEKNAFAIYAPLPQASDHSRDWELESENNGVSAGLSGQWQLARNIELALDYSYVETTTEQAITTFGAADLVDSALPDVDTTQHRLDATGTWHMSDSLSLQLDYRYGRFSSDDWAWQDVQANTLDRVLTFGESNPNETVHYMGVSALYRWQ